MCWMSLQGILPSDVEDCCYVNSFFYYGIKVLETTSASTDTSESKVILSMSRNGLMEIILFEKDYIFILAVRR